MTVEGLSEREFAAAIAANGGRLFRVGGCVRDALMGRVPDALNFCVVGMVKKQFKTLFPTAEELGKGFPVFLLRVEGKVCKAAFARTERKIGSGHKGFKVQSNPKITVVEDLMRRDLTVNAIAVDCLTGEVIDPLHGLQDIHDRILRAVGSHFADDPIRGLRLAGDAARLTYAIEPHTLSLARSVAKELVNEPVERIAAELAGVLADAQEPARFFRVLRDADLLPCTFVELSALPEDEFELAMSKLDAVARVTREPKLRFAALGVVLDHGQLAQWNARMNLPGEWLDAAVTARRVLTLLIALSPTAIVDAITGLRRGSLSLEEFNLIATALAIIVPDLKRINAAMKIPSDEVPETLAGKERGAWLRTKQIERVAKLLVPVQ